MAGWLASEDSICENLRDLRAKIKNLHRDTQRIHRGTQRRTTHNNMFQFISTYFNIYQNDKKLL